MKAIKRWLSLCLILTVLALQGPPALAARVSASEAISALETLELVQGTGSGFEPLRTATRAEAVTMLLRLLGLEAAARAETGACPFYDGGWAAPYLTYAWKNGLVQGKSGTYFGSAEAVSVRDYLTMTLRALGYDDAAGDFSWRDSIAFAEQLGLTHGEFSADGSLLREDLALISYTALTLPMHTAPYTLVEQLYLDGAVSAAALKQTRLVWALGVSKPVYTPAQLHDMSASAVFYVECFRDEEALNKNKSDAHGSGFFVTADGLALLSYHELDGYAYARATTLDGAVYDITGVLAYDPLWDYAVVRVSRQAVDGSTVRAFPWLDLGDSDAVYPGEPVYAVSNPLGLVDSISAGMISNRARTVDDPEYPMLQMTTPISKGSSGGPVLNRHGEVVGIIHGMFENGQLLNIATPVNSISSLGGEALPLTAVLENENAKKAAATITVSPQTELALHCGQSVELTVTHTCPGTANVQYEISDTTVAECKWGKFTSKHTVPLTVTGVGSGETEIVIRFADGYGNTEATVQLTVRVSDAAEAD